MAQLELIYVVETENNTEEKYLCTVTKRNEIQILKALNGEKIIIPITEWEDIKNYIDQQFTHYEP